MEIYFRTILVDVLQARFAIRKGINMKDIKSFIEIWKKFQYMLTPSQKIWGSIVFIMSIFGSLAEMLGVSVILPFAQVMMSPEKLLQYNIIAKLCYALDINTDQKLVFLIAIFVVLVYIFKNLYLSFLAYVRAKFSAKIQREMSIRITHSYVNRGYSFFRTANIAKLLRGSRESIAGVQVVIYQFFKILTELLTIVCIFIYVAVTDIQIVAVMFLLAIVCLLIVITVFRKIVKDAGQKAYDSTVSANKWQLQLYEGIKEILVLNKQKFFLNNYANVYEKWQKAMVVQAVAQEMPAYMIEGICVTGLILAVSFRIAGIENSVEYFPMLASFAVAAFRIMPSIGRISSSFNAIIYQIPAVNETYENILETDKCVEATKKIRKKGETETSEDKINFHEEIAIQDIRYKYPDGNEYVLDGVSVRVKKGESIGLVGPSGAGKSTLADIILGLYIPQKGRIVVDHRMDIQEYRESWAQMVGYVPQRVYLLDDTVRRNIAFGILDEDIIDDRVWSVLEQAQLSEFIRQLPDGLDTTVGEQGVRFSGGQAQRLAIARALYSNPDILVMDEATSALDSETENAVMEAIETLQGQKTMIIIAHRLSTIKKCDHIFEINHGNAIERDYQDLI